jgi:5-methylcytosine-specific restriction endonuclease McrA
MPGRLEPLSATRYRVEFTARAELRDKVERARELLSHALPSGDLGELFERALDALIEKQTRERLGAGRPRKARKLKEGSRHVPVEIARAVRERDHGQCTYVDAEGRRCSERRFVTLEHRQPFALGGPPTLDNVCLLCARHNAESAGAVFGERHIQDKIQARTQQPHADVPAKVLSALCHLGFRRRNAAAAIERVRASEPALEAEQLLRRSLLLLVPAPN